MATNCSVLGIPELEHPWGLHWAPGLATILREVTVPRERTDPQPSEKRADDPKVFALP